MKLHIEKIAAAGAVAIALAASNAAAEMPKTMAWTAYGTTSSGYAQSAAIGNMLKAKFGTNLRILPGKNDVSRMLPLKQGRVDLCACGIAAYFGQEGIALFAKKGWGPQKVRLIMSSSGSYGLAVATAKDANIKTPADFKGKRIAWVTGGDALNINAGAYLAFGGVDWNDVKKVTVSGFKASVDAIINGQADAAFMSTVTPHAKRLGASPRGIHWPALDPNNKDGWARMQKAAPYYYPHTATVGADITADKPLATGGYPYPILIGNADFDTGTAYSLTKALVENYDDYKDKAPGAKGWALSSQKLEWALPYNEGSVKLFKEKGVWTDAAQKHNDALIARQDVLAKAWAAFEGSAPSDEGEFRKAWMAARGAALKAAGMPVIFN